MVEPVRSRRVLIVDDNVDGLRIIALMLRSWGHVVEVCHQSERAVQIAIDFHPEFVLLDLGMPRLSGLDIAKSMQNTPTLEKVRLIAVTGYGHSQDISRTREAGFEEHLVKPIDFETLKRILGTGVPPERT